MSDRQTGDDEERRITTDRDTIRNWADERNAVPAYREDADEREQHRFFPRGEVGEGYQERDWDTFFDDFESNDRAFVYHEDEEAFDRHEIVARDEAAARASVADRDVEERLVDGETVTTQVTETTVVEREIVETETIESEVTDRHPVSGRVTEAELVDWEILDSDTEFDLTWSGDVTDREVRLRGDEADYSDLDLTTTVTGDVTAEVEEQWRIDRETEERLTVESRVVDVDVEEEDRVAEDSVETSVDAAGVERSIVQSDILGGTTDADTTDTTGTMGDADATGPDVVDTDAIETTAVEDSETLRFESRLVERRQYEDEVRRRKRIHFDVTDVEIVDTETVESGLLSSEIVEVDYDDDETRAGDDAGTTADTGTDTATGAGRTGAAVTLSEDDEGKTVVDSSGDEVGLVVDVEGNTLYVDANPGFFERLEAALGWESRDEDAYPITADQIAEIDDRRVVLEHSGEDAVEGGR